ncbi:MAG: Spy/CpxP family protein refolding chaperone [Betaproteobacteria bacterium]|nr:Spy/CpxP family protein refolding chaperone [Betaproteobacteria bacterium]
MKSRFVVAALAAACLSTAAAAQMGQGMGPGMTGGRGMGPGMAAGDADCPMGAGKMGGHRMGGHMKGGGMMGGGMMGGGMMGGGMMGGGMGGGMMGGGMMGGGMMGGHRMGGAGPLEALGLSDEQQGKVRDIQRDLQKQHHALMGSMMELRWQSEDNAKSATFDEAAARKHYDAVAALQKRMFETRMEAQKRIQDVLTKEQREQLRR